MLCCVFPVIYLSCTYYRYFYRFIYIKPYMQEAAAGPVLPPALCNTELAGRITKTSSSHFPAIREMVKT